MTEKQSLDLPRWVRICKGSPLQLTFAEGALSAETLWAADAWTIRNPSLAAFHLSCLICTCRCCAWWEVSSPERRVNRGAAVQRDSGFGVGGTEGSWTVHRNQNVPRFSPRPFAQAGGHRFAHRFGAGRRANERSREPNRAAHPEVRSVQQDGARDVPRNPRPSE